MIFEQLALALKAEFALKIFQTGGRPPLIPPPLTPMKVPPFSPLKFADKMLK